MLKDDSYGSKTAYWIFYYDETLAATCLLYGNKYYNDICGTMNCLACGGCGPSLFIATILKHEINQIDFSSEGNFIKVPIKTPNSIIEEDNEANKF